MIARRGRFAPMCQTVVWRDLPPNRQRLSTVHGVVFAFFCLARPSGLLHRPEGDGIAARLDRRDAVLPLRPRLAVHHVKRARPGFERVALPFVAVTTAETEFAGRAERQAEDLFEVRLVPMPADAEAGLIFGAELLPDAAVSEARPCLDL